MKFVLLVFQGSTPTPTSTAWSTLSDAEQQAIYSDYAAINETDGVTPGLPLGLPDHARTVTVRDGSTQVTDGPYLGDVSSAAGGYFIVEADSIEAAIEIASRVPAARHGGGGEIRPVATYW
jgi:hypothetical protein